MDPSFLTSMREEFMNEFVLSPPELFLDTEKSGLYGYDHFPVKVFPALNDFITKNYRVEAEVQGIAIYRRIR